MDRLAISPTLLRWALERAGLTVEAAREKFPKLEEWLSGEAGQGPTMSQLEKFAHRTHTPLGFLFLQAPPEERLPIPDFRTITDNRPRRPSPELMETVAAMQERQAWVKDELVTDGVAPLDFVGSVESGVTFEAIAASMRRKLGLEDGWAAEVKTIEDALRHLRKQAEAAGIFVMANGVVGNNTHRPLRVEEFRGFALTDRHAPLIFINNADTKGAQMFTFAHELAHLWLGREGLSNPDAAVEDTDTNERFCNRIAAEFLVPAAKLTALWPTVAETDEPVELLARRFKVSPMVVARTAKELGLLSQTEFVSFIRSYRDKIAALPERAGGGGDFWLTQGVRVGDRFGRAVVRAAKEGRILYRDAYRLVGIHGKTFDTYATKLGYAN